MTQCRGDEGLRVLPETERIRARFLPGASRTGKHSFRRAVLRAAREGRALYRGKWYTAKQLGAIRISFCPCPRSEQPVHKPVRKSVPKQVDQPVGKPVDKPVHKSVAQPVVKPVATPTVQPVTARFSNRFRSKPGESVRYGRLKCFSWNCGGLPVGKMDELVAYLELNSYQVAFVQETRWRHTSMWEAGGYFCIHSGEAKEGGNSWCGVMTMISKTLTSSSLLRFSSYIDGRVLHVRVPMQSGVYDLVNCYQQQLTGTSHCLHIREQVWDALGKLLSHLPLRNAIIVGGDYNSPCLYRPPWIGSACCKASEHHSEHDFLGDLIEVHDLCWLNSWKGKSVPTFVTYSVGISAIDGVLVRRGHADDHSKQSQPLFGCPLLFSSSGSYHFPLSCSIPMLWRCWSRRSALPRRLNMEKLVRDSRTGNEHWQQLATRAASILPTPSLAHLESLNGDLRQLCDSLYGATSSQRTAYSRDSGLISMYHCKWRLWKELRKPSGSGLHAVLVRWRIVTRLQALTRVCRRRSKLLRKHRLQEIFSSASRASKHHDVHGLFTQIRRLSPKIPRRQVSIRDSDGRLMSPHAEGEFLRSYFGSIFCECFWFFGS